jgi:hypothetical protein
MLFSVKFNVAKREVWMLVALLEATPNPEPHNP